MAYTGASIPEDHTEFGGGPGLVDPQLRKDRVFDSQPYAELWEVYATNPADENSDPETVTLERPE
jgi:hypothetical protein